MKSKTIWIIWGCLWALTAILGFVPASGSAGKAVLTAIALAFFVPPTVLLIQGERKSLLWLRGISLIWLAVAFLLLILNLLSIRSSRVVGDMLHCLLTVFSPPMVCGQNWMLSVFLWACLLFASISRLKHRKTT